MFTFPIRAGMLAILLAARAMVAGPPAHPADTSATANRAGASMAFWEEGPRHGANCMNDAPPSLDYLTAARAQGIRWIRLAWDKWAGSRRDFLLGNADRYEGLVPADLETLLAALDRARAADLKVVVVPLSLPGMRWRQNNGGRFDGRIWQDQAWWDQAAGFWRDLAARLKGHPALASYNLVNEPAPEYQAGVAEDATPGQLQSWYRKVRGTARDLPAFCHRLAEAIREADGETPIMVDAGWYARPAAWTYWPAPMADPKVLYAFHMYEPYGWSCPANTRRPKPFAYPGRVPSADGRVRLWNRASVARFLEPAYAWARAQGIPANRMVAAEFGCHRRAPGAAAYLEDVLSVLDAHRSHWAFYSFREPYDGFDYELGSGKLPWNYWKAWAEGRDYPLTRGDNPVFHPISRRLRKP
jgi:hypothetical protein